MSKVFFVFLVILFFVASFNFVQAKSLEIVGNGTGSQNSITVKGSNTSTNQQNNNTDIQNTIKTKADTGDNSTSGNNGNSTIVTGDSTVSVTVINKGNSNTAKIDGCCKDPTPTPTKKPTPTPTPTPGPNNGGGNGNGGNGGGNGGSSGGVGGGSNPQIIGLSKTSGNGLDQYLFYTAGLLCLSLGGKLLLKH